MDSLSFIAYLRLKYLTILTHRVNINIDTGWQGLIKQMLEEIMIQPYHNSIQISVIKQKFASLRVYYDGNDSASIKQIIEKYQEKAKQTCEFCGCKTTRLVWFKSWQMVCCEECEAEKKPPESSSEEDEDEDDDE